MIPRELRDVPQWLVSGESKIPISPKTGRAADVRDRSLFATYDEAVAYASSRGMDIGFALTRDDPFAVIDLDSATATTEQQTRHQKIYEAFPTYAELSRSRGGVHIWCLGTVPHGARRDKVEVYAADRYMITTGLVLKDVPIADCQDLLNILYAEMDPAAYAETDLQDVDEVASDEDVFNMASGAVNGDKFDQLCRGDWEHEYPSQSEADYALMNMLCFYTRSNEQARRLFRYSALGRRDKAQRDAYLNTMIRKIRSEEVPLVDFSGLKVSGNGKHTEPPVDVRTPEPPSIPEEKNPPQPVASKADFTYPPGFVGEIARYIYATSGRPVREVSVAAALTLCAGVLGRQFNVSSTGLNQYLILLAKTGVGKEDGPRGIERILSAVRAKVPVVDSFQGPGTFASGQAIIRTLDEQPCFFSVLGEFGYTLQELSDVNQNSLSRVMRRVLLDLYTKSGRSSVLQSSAYSDREKNTKTLYAPAMTLLGESTPETFYEGLSLHHIESGLIPRFLIIEYEGDRTDRNPNAFEPPDERIISRFADLAEVVLRMQSNHAWAEVEIGGEAQAVLDQFDRQCDDHIRGGANEAVRQLWNRAHLKALRLSALLACADRPHTTIVNRAEAEWAIDVVVRDVMRLTARFESGDVGEGDSKQVADMERVLKDFQRRPIQQLMSYGVTEEMKRYGCVPYVYLQRRLFPLASYRKDRRGAKVAVEETIQLMAKTGRLELMPKQQAKSMFGFGGMVYRIIV